MNLIRFKSLSGTILLPATRYLPNIRSGSHMRLYASAANGRKNGKNRATLFSKEDITMQSDPKHISLPLNRRPLSIKQTSGESSQSPTSSQSPPPPPQSSSSSSNMAWIGAAAAILVGGGVYLVSQSKGKSDTTTGKAKVFVPPTKPNVPSTSSEIPKEVPYLLIGGGTASFAAFRAIKSHDPKAKVMVISDEIETPYMRPPLSKELWLAELGAKSQAQTNNGSTGNGNGSSSSSSSSSGSSDSDTESLKFKQWNGIERSLYYEPNDFYTHPSKLLDEPNGGVTIVRGYKVKKIDVESNVAVLSDGTEIKYQRCLIATGSTPRSLPIFEQAPAKIKERVSMFKTIEDFQSLKNQVDQSKSIAIIGGGFLGSELACALAKYGENRKLQVHQIFFEKGNMGKVLPEFLSKWTTERVREEGVNVIPNTEVKNVDSVGNQIKLTLNNGQTIVCDRVVLAVGSEPNTGLGRESGLEIENKHGGYLVNAELAARNNLYVAGDAACFYDTRLGRRRVEHHDHAVVSGRLAGENMVGLGKPYKHQSMFWSDLGPNIGYEALGIIDSTLPTVSVFVKKPKDSAESASESDKSKAVAKTSVQAAASAASPSVQAAAPTAANDEPEDFSKGVVFYLRDDKIVGIVLWNVFNRINTARAVLSQDKVYDDLNEVAKLFDLYL